MKKSEYRLLENSNRLYHFTFQYPLIVKKSMDINLLNCFVGAGNGVVIPWKGEEGYESN